MMTYLILMFGLSTLAFIQQASVAIRLIFGPDFDDKAGFTASLLSRVVLLIILGADGLMVGLRYATKNRMRKLMDVPSIGLRFTV